MADVKLSNVEKAFGDVVAVSSFDLSIGDGELVVFVGPSGCGKTTTLRMIAGLERATRGSIHIGDRRVDDLPPGERDVAMVFQSYALYPHLSVADNITLNLRARKVSRDEMSERLEQVTTLLEIDHLIDRRPAALSGGQKQRVAVARAIIRRPSVLLMDEPLSNLDARLRASMRAELRDLVSRLGITTVYVTHDQVEAMTLGDRIVVMNEGSIQQVGTPSDVYDRPANLFVVGMMGSPPMNQLPMTIEGGEGKWSLSTNGIQTPVNDAAVPLTASASSQVIGCIRPEQVGVDACTPDSKPRQLLGKVRLVENHGAVFVVRTNTSVGEVVATAQKDPGLKSGDTVQVTWAAEDLQFFDPATEQAL